MASLAALGVDLVKLRNPPRPDAVRALLARASGHGLPVAAHQPSRAVGLAGAVAAGLRSLEHLEQLGEFAELSSSARDSLARGMATAEFWITPTIVTSMGRFLSDSAVATVVERTVGEPDRLVPAALRTFWRQQMALRQFDAPRDPLADIRATRRITGVVRRGRWLGGAGWGRQAVSDPQAWRRARRPPPAGPAPARPARTA